MSGAHKEVSPQQESFNGNAGNGAALSRQVTVTLNPEDYERLFFQPSQAKGDLAKRLGNPTLLGLLGFLIPFQTAMFCLLGWRGANATSFVAVSGAFFFLGGICMNIAGIFELILGNTFPGAVFLIYGSHWCQVGYSYDPAHNLAGAYAVGDIPGSAALAYNSGNGMYNITMLLVSFVFFLPSLRTNVPFALAIFCLIPLFAFLAAANFYIGYHPTAEGIAYAGYLLEIGGGFGFVTALCGWYLAVITACASTGIPCPLPIFDLSTKIGVGSKAAALEHAGATTEPVNGSKA